MKVTRFLATLAFLSVAASSAFAQGSVNLSWTGCTGPVNLAVAPGSAPYAVASVLGHNTPHSGYQVWMLLGTGPNGPMRDAWRFDPTGCEGSSFITIDHLAPAALSKACPTFMGSAAGVQIKDYSFDALTGKCQAVMANGYAAGSTTTVNPAVRYFLAGFKFDMLFAVNGPSDPGNTCGGLETPVCVHITKDSWISLADGVEHNWAIQQEFISSNDAANSTGCPGATPAVSKSWGSIKSTYRN